MDCNTMESNLKASIAKELLKIGAVFLRPDEPFTWASGIKSPIYCDNRLTLSYPKTREKIEKAFAQTIAEKFPQVDRLMGTSTAGIPHAAIAGYLLQLPMGYVRGSAKDHGRTNQIEGVLQKGDSVVVIEDLISTGGSSMDTVLALRKAGAKVEGIVSIFTYGMKKAEEKLAENNVTAHSLCDLDSLAKVAVKEGYITETGRQQLLAFRNNPADESWIDGGNSAGK